MHNQNHRIKQVLFVFLFAISAIGVVRLKGAQANQSVPVTTVSAASFEQIVAPEAIVAAFGANLATRVVIAETVPLPTTLAGTTVKVQDSAGTERLAPLFFVAPTQVNYLIPAGTTSGTANVTITSGDNKTSTGTVQVARVAPALFTANANGQGAPAAVALRVKADGAQSFEPVATFDSTTNRFVLRPIDLGPESEQVFLILFGGGFRNRRDQADVNVKIGGADAEVLFASASPDLVGVDQLNLRLPRTLIGRGRVNLVLAVTGFSASNLTELEIASPAGTTPPQIADVSSGTTLAGQTLTINGTGFDSTLAANLVRIGGVEARVVSATTNQITVRVPFGVGSGPVTVRTQQGEGRSTQALRVRTSISGVIEDTGRQPLSGVVVKIANSQVSDTTNAEGAFLLPDAPGNLQFLEIDSSRVRGSLPFPTVRLKFQVQANRDNQLTAPVALQQIAGPSLQVGVPSSSLLAQQTSGGRVQTGNVVFEVPSEATANFPDGGANGQLTLSLVAGSRTPVSLPPGTFSSTVAQIAPFGVRLSPGAKLTFPNSDGFPAGTQARLFRLDQTPGSATIGSFIDAGTARVSADGQRIETASDAVRETSIYFAAIPRPTTTLAGRVVDSDGVTPVRLALVRSRGQEVFTDGNGGFVLRNVLVNAGDEISIEAGFTRATGRVDRVQRDRLSAVAGGVTNLTPDLVLPSEASNRLPLIFIPTSLALNENDIREVRFLAGDPDEGQRTSLSLSGAGFASLTPQGNDLYVMRITPRANDAGRYTLRLTATDDVGGVTTLPIALRVSRPPQTTGQSVTTDEDTPVAVTLRANDPDNDPLDFIIVNNPARGTLSGTAPNLVYTPFLNLNGSDVFSFKVNDGLSDSQIVTVAIFVTPVNDPPVLIAPGSMLLDTGKALAFSITASDTEGDMLSITASGLPGGATFRQTGPTTGQFDWTPGAAQFGAYNLTFTVRDNGSPPLNVSRNTPLTVTPRWKPTTAIEGGYITALLSRGSDIFAATQAGGIFRSSNQGQSWTQINNGLPAPAALVVSSLTTVGGTLFAALQSYGVFSSTDNGQNWRPANAGLPLGISFTADVLRLVRLGRCGR